MIPVGYNAKVVVNPEWLGDPDVAEILSVSECISESPIEHFDHWLFNAWRLYDTEPLLDQALVRCGHRVHAHRRFFYEAHPRTILGGAWRTIDRTFSDVLAPDPGFLLRGYDIVCIGAESGPGCSPLSCNRGAKEVRVNRHCLLDDLEAALEVAERIDADGGYEPGPYGVFAVHEARR